MIYIYIYVYILTLTVILPSQGSGGPAAVTYLLSRMTPRDAIVELSSKELTPRATLTEPIYGTKYGRQPISPEISAWEAAPLLSSLSPPKANRFIPRKLALKSPTDLPRKPNVPSPTPVLLVSAPSARVHFLPDRTFARPRAYAYFMWRSADFYTTPRVAVAAELFGSLLAEKLQVFLVPGVLVYIFVFVFSYLYSLSVSVVRICIRIRIPVCVL